MAVRKDSIQIRVEIEAKQSVRTYQKLLDETRQVNNEMRRLKRLGQENSKEFKAVEKRARDLNQEMNKLGGRGANFAQLITRSKQLNRELKSLVPGTKRFIEVTTELKEVNSRIRDVRDETKGVSKNLEEMRIAGIKIPPVVQRIAGAFAAFTVADFLKEAVTGLFNLGKEMEIFGKKAETVFGEALPIVQEFAEQYGHAMGLTVDETINAATSIGDLLIPIGFQREEAAALSTELVGLSGALSQWSGGQHSAQEVTNILSKAILGEREELKSLGIAINEDAVKAKLREKGMDKLTGQYLEQAKAVATMELILEKSQDAQTAFAENTDEIADKQALLRAQFAEVREDVAKRLIPIFNSLLDIGLKVLEWGLRFIMILGSIPKFIKENKVEIAALTIALIALNAQQIAASISALRMAAATKASVIATKAMVIAQRALNFVMKANPIGLVVAALSLLVAGLKIAHNRSGAFRAALAGLSNVAQELFKIVKESVSTLLEGFNQIKEGNIKAGLAKIGQVIVKSNPIGLALTEGKRLKDSFVEGFQEKKLEDTMAKEEESLKAGLQQLQDPAKKEGEAIGDKIIDGINDRLKNAPIEVEVSESTKIKEERKKDQALLNPLEEIGSSQTDSVESTGEAEINTTAEEEVLKNKFLQALITEQEYEDQRFQLQQDAYDRRLEFLREKFGEESAEFVALENQKLESQKNYEAQSQELTKRTEEARKQIRDASLGAFQDFIGVTIDLLKGEEGERKKNSVALKAFAAGKVIVDTQQAIMGIIKNAESNPANILFPAAGALISGLKIAGVVAKSGIAINKIRKAGFYYGGHTGNAPIFKDDAGRDVVGAVHKNEWVGPEWQVNHPVYGPVINWLEAMRQRGYKDGGFTEASTTPAAINTNAATASPVAAPTVNEELMREVIESNRQVVAAINRKNFNVTTGQIRDALDEDYRLDAKSGF